MDEEMHACKDGRRGGMDEETHACKDGGMNESMNGGKG
jgi:hypothetical protein